MWKRATIEELWYTTFWRKHYIWMTGLLSLLALNRFRAQNKSYVIVWGHRVSPAGLPIEQVLGGYSLP